MRDSGSTSVMPPQKKEWKALLTPEALKKQMLFLQLAENFCYLLELFHKFLILQLKIYAVLIFF